MICVLFERARQTALPDTSTTGRPSQHPSIFCVFSLTAPIFRRQCVKSAGARARAPRRGGGGGGVDVLDNCLALVVYVALDILASAALSSFARDSRMLATSLLGLTSFRRVNTLLKKSDPQKSIVRSFSFSRGFSLTTGMSSPCLLSPVPWRGHEVALHICDAGGF